MHAQKLDISLGVVLRGAIPWHEIGHTDAQLFFDDLVAQRQLLFEVIDVVVPLLDMKLSPVFLALKVDLLKIQQVLIVLDVNLLYLLLEQLMLVFLQHFVPDGLHLDKCSS